jgi:hypothetical protein
MSGPLTKNLQLEEIQHLLTAVFTLCSLDPAITEDKLNPLITSARLAAKKRVSRLAPNRKVVVDLDVLGHVIYIWQRTPNYLDRNGQALAIPARGRAPSIEALFRDVKRSKYFELGLRHLMEVGRIRRLRDGRFKPTSEVSIVTGLTPEMVKLLSQTINRLVSTVLHNTSQRNPAALKLVERVTTVPDLPAKHAKAFKEFAREQGGALINTMNEWLESRRGPRKARVLGTPQNITAGLHVFAFVERNRR